MARKISNNDFADVLDNIHSIDKRTVRIEEHLVSLNGSIGSIKKEEENCRNSFNTRLNKNEDRINDLYVKLALLIGAGGTGGGIIGVIVGKILGF